MKTIFIPEIEEAATQCRGRFDRLSVNNSSLQLSIWDNRHGSLALFAWDGRNNFIGHRRWRLDSTAALVRAYWLVRAWTRQSRWNRTMTFYKHSWMKWSQYGPPLVNQYQMTPAVIDREGV